MKKIGLLVMIAGFILLFFHIKVNEIFDKITILYAFDYFTENEPSIFI